MSSHRVQKVASIVREVVSDAITNRLSDPRISPFASVTRVEVSGDLSYSTVLISVMGNEATARKTMIGLEHARGHIQTLLARRLNTRQCPHLRFRLDESIKRGDQTIRMIDETMAREEGDSTPREATGADGTGPAGDEDIGGPA